MAGVCAPGGTVGIGRQEPLASDRADVSRRSAITGAAIALAAGALAGCGTGREAAPMPVVAQRSDTELSDMIDGTPELAVAGERLNPRLLRHFYARHGFNPVWTTRRAQADSLVEAVLRASDHGLDPELFHASLLWRRETFPPLHRDLLLSDAFLSYADALAHGAVPLDRRKDVEALSPEPVDVAAVLDAAMASRDPAAVVEALAPTTPTYTALREALQRSRPGVAIGGQFRDGPRADHPGEPRTPTLAAAGAAGGPRLGQCCRPGPGSVSRQPSGFLRAGRRWRGRRAQTESRVPRPHRGQFLQSPMGHSERHRCGRDPADHQPRSDIT